MGIQYSRRQETNRLIGKMQEYNIKNVDNR